MATVNFSVPETVKKMFDETFTGENKSAVLARLMKQAIVERQREIRRSQAIDALLELRQETRPTSGEKLRRARRAGRP